MHFYLLSIYKIQLLLVLFVLYYHSHLADERIGDRPLVVQWLRLCALNAGGLDSIRFGNKTPHAATKNSKMSQLKILHAVVKSEDPTCCN